MQNLLALLLFIGLSLGLRYELLSVIETQYLGGASHDAGLYVWLSQTALTSLIPQQWYTLPAFYPYQKTLAWSDNFILPSLLISLLTKASGNHILAYNCCLLLASALNGFCTYLLGQKIYRSFNAAILSGAAFLSLSYFSTHLGHPQLQFAFFIPLVIYLYFAMENRSSSSAMIFLPLTVLAAFLTTVYYFLFGVLILAFLLLWSAIRAAYIKRLPRWLSPSSVLIILTPCSLLIPFVLPYFETSKIFHTRHLYEARQFAATPLSYLSAGPFSWLYGPTSDFSHSEAWLFPGALLLFSFIVSYLISAWKQRCLSAPLTLLGSITTLWLAFVLESTQFLMVAGGLFWFTLVILLFSFCRPHSREWTVMNVGVFFLILSFGPLGSEVSNHFPTGPYAAFFSLFPGMDALRASGRLGIVFLFTCALSLGGLYQHFKERYGMFGACYAMLIFPILHGVEQFHDKIPVELPIEAPDSYKQMTSIIQDKDAFFVFPQTAFLTPALQVARWGDFSFHNVNVMNWSLDHPGKTINGYTGLRTHVMKDYPRKLSGFPDERSRIALSLFPDLRFLVFRSSLVKDFDKKDFLKKLRLYADTFTILNEDDDGNYLLRMTPHTLLTDRQSFLLRTPANPEQQLVITLENTEAQPRTIDIFIDDRFEKSPYRTLHLDAGDKKVYNIPLPIQTPEMAPLVFRFVPDKPSTVILHDRQLEFNS